MGSLGVFLLYLLVCEIDMLPFHLSKAFMETHMNILKYHKIRENKFKTKSAAKCNGSRKYTYYFLIFCLFGIKSVY